jgi:hypothetical protein
LTAAARPLVGDEIEVADARAIVEEVRTTDTGETLIVAARIN